MSYILDALRKADSERERGEVPGLHAHPVVPTGDDTPGSHVNQKLLLAVGVLTALLLLTLIWLMWGRSASQPDRPPMPPDQAGLGMPPGGPTPPPAQWSAQNSAQNGTSSGMPQEGTLAAPPQPGGVGMAPAMAQTEPPPVLGKPTQGLYPPAMTQQPAVDTAAPTAPKTTLPGMSSDQASSAAPRKATTAASSKTSEDNKVYRLMDLPESVRRDLPTLTIGGAMYSDTPSNRMLIINSQVLHEGDKITSDLTLEEIKLKSAVFRFRTYRYLVSY